MKFIRENITTILIVVIAVFGVLQLKSCFDKYHKPEAMIRNEEKIKYLEEKRLTDSVALVDIRGKYDSLILLSVQKFGALQNKFQQTKVIYEKIPVIIGDYDREQLRRAVSGF